jgi:SPP1 family predicted phage head-tail adaptor
MRRDDDVRAGELTARVTLRGTVLNEDDEEIQGAVLAENVPAQKRVLRGRELTEAGRDVAEQWTEFRIRYRAGLDSTTRLEQDGRAYNVQAIDDPTGNRRVLVISARAVR